MVALVNVLIISRTYYILAMKISHIHRRESSSLSKSEKQDMFHKKKKKMLRIKMRCQR